MTTTKLDLSRRIKANFALLSMVTPEERRALHTIALVASELQRSLYVWSITRGIERVSIGAKGDGGRTIADKTQRPGTFPELLAGKLTGSAEPVQNAIVVALDFGPYFRDPIVVRALRDALTAAEGLSNTGVLLSASLDLPVELQRECAAVDQGLPERDELRGLIELSHATNHESLGIEMPSGDRLERLVDAMRGLTTDEANNALALALVSQRDFDAGIVSAEKARAVKTSGAIEIQKPPELGLEAVGGMEGAKAWVRTRGKAFSKAARAYGLPNPKGSLLLGVQGCGKSAIAKATAKSLDLPLVRLNVGALFGGIVGATEGNVRAALRTLDAIAPCVCLIDEIEKAFAGLKGGASDGGVGSRMLGEFLTWMQEHTSPVFIMATANDVTQLPPELLRLGRWDTMLFVDLPTAEEREAILRIQVAAHCKLFTIAPAEYRHVADVTDGFSGAELEQVVINSLFEAFADGERGVIAADLLAAAETTVPLSRTMMEPITQLREWAKTRCVPASGRIEKKTTARTGRKVH